MPSEVWALVLDGRRIKPSMLPASYFLVDGDDWLAHILKGTAFKNSSFATTAALDESVRKLHTDLNAMGIQPIVFLDKVQPKSVKSSRPPIDYDNQRAQLVQLRKTLKSLSVDIEDCDSIRRAGIMVDFFRTMTARGEYSCYIYGSSLLDLWAVKGVPYILFDTLSITDAEKVQAPVWTKAIVAAALFVTESQLTELMILVGNRYTKPFGRKGYRSAQGGGVPNAFLDIENDESRGIKFHSREPKCDDMISLASMRDWMLLQGEDFRLRFADKFAPSVESPFSTVHAAIEFSRVYYNNGDSIALYNAMELKKLSAAATDSARQPAAAAIMAAISGASAAPAPAPAPSSNSRTVTITSGKKATDSSIYDVRHTESEEKLQSKRKEAVKKSSERKSRDVGREVEVEVSRKVKREKGDMEEKKGRTETSNSVLVPVAATSAVVNVDETKGTQLRNLLGIKFGLKQPANVTSPSPDTVLSESPAVHPKASQEKEKEAIPAPSQAPLPGQSSAVIAAAAAAAAVTAAVASDALECAPKVFRGDESQSPVPTRRLLMGGSSSSSKQSPSSSLSLSSSSRPPVVLPIDAHKSEILTHIADNSVTIIHGSTGCGKSSRVPQMLLEQGESEGKPTMIMVSQPRRIAVTALKRRLHEALGAKVGLRMGNGVREESASTRLWFVTTGYLVALLAHHMESFSKYTHLVIDEVHERSADGDIICLLAKKVLEVLPHMKIILMSATVHTALYENYFNIPGQTISVAGKTFSHTFIYCDELFSMLPVSVHNHLRALMDATTSCKGSQGEIVPAQIVKNQRTLAVALTKQIASEGSSVLIFVADMADIIELSEKLEKIKIKGLKLKVIAIHSDIPFEDQMLAFQPSQPGEAKVIVATNAAESSLTFTDCDHVICLGSHKMLAYNDKHNTSQLVKCWVSKASANQRAGRTGRMRPGTVYRLYSLELYSKLPDHNPSELHRLPLGEVILRLRVSLEKDKSKEESSTKSPILPSIENAEAEESAQAFPGTGTADNFTSPSAAAVLPLVVKSRFDFRTVIPVLMALIEPPEMSRVKKSLQLLYDSGMISSPDDAGTLTETGKIAGRLPVDLQLGRFVSYGVQVGLAREAVIMAAALSLPKSPFRIACALIHSDPDEYNKIVKDSFFAKSRLDRGHLSEPLMLLHALMEYRACDSEKEKFDWCQSNCLAHTRMLSFDSVATNLQNRLDEISARAASSEGRGVLTTEGSAGSTELSPPAFTRSLPLHYPLSVSTRTANMLRLVSLWSFHSNLLKLNPRTSSSDTAQRSAQLPVSSINADMISSIFKSPLAQGTEKDRAGNSAAGRSALQSWAPSPVLSGHSSPKGPGSAQATQSYNWDETSILNVATMSESDVKDVNCTPPFSVPVTQMLTSSSAISLSPDVSRKWTEETDSIEKRVSGSGPGSGPGSTALEIAVAAVSSNGMNKSGEPEVQWRLGIEGLRTYTAEYSDRSFENILTSFTSCVQEMHVPVAWMLSKQSIPEKTIIVMTDKLALSVLEFLRGVYPGSLEVLGSYDGRTVASTGSSSEKQINRLEELYNENISALSWTLSAATPRRSSSSNIYSRGGTSSSNNIYSIGAGSSSAESAQGSALLVCANCMPTDLQIRELFLGSGESRVTSLSTLNPSPNEPWKPVSKMIRSKMTIEFLPDLPSAYCAGGEDVVLVGSKRREMMNSSSAKVTATTTPTASTPTSTTGTSTVLCTTPAKMSESDSPRVLSAAQIDRLTASTPPPTSTRPSTTTSTPTCSSSSNIIPRREILKNIPLGLQLLNSIKLGGRGFGGSIALVGRGEGFSGTLREGKEVLVKVQSEDAAWVANRLGNIGITGSKVEELLNSGGKMRSVVMPTHSLQQVAQNTGTEAVFAVSHVLSLVGDEATRAEGVTLLPVGGKWSALALECVGVCSSGLRLTPEEEPSMDELSQAAFAAKQFRCPTASSSRDIWRTVDSLFSTWLKDADSASGDGVGEGDQGSLWGAAGDLDSALGALNIDASASIGQNGDTATHSGTGSGTVVSTASWLFQGCEQDPDGRPVKAKRLKAPVVPSTEPASDGWWTATKK